jgi:hypothetical protein
VATLTSSASLMLGHNISLFLPNAEWVTGICVISEAVFINFTRGAGSVIASDKLLFSSPLLFCHQIISIVTLIHHILTATCFLPFLDIMRIYYFFSGLLISQHWPMFREGGVFIFSFYVFLECLFHVKWIKYCIIKIKVHIFAD